MKMPQTVYCFIVLAVCFTYVLSQGASGDHPATQACLGCICDASSNCNITKHCAGDVCGPFRITWPYWSDGGKPTLNGESPDSNTAYGNCAQDPYCAGLAVQGYMTKFQQDCNNDGKIDCDDYAAIHKLGGYGCQGGLPEIYKQRYLQCKSIVGQERF